MTDAAHLGLPGGTIKLRCDPLLHGPQLHDLGVVLCAGDGLLYLLLLRQELRHLCNKYTDRTPVVAQQRRPATAVDRLVRSISKCFVNHAPQAASDVNIISNAGIAPDRVERATYCGSYTSCSRL